MKSTCIAIVVFYAAIAASPKADARPPYVGVFKELYPRGPKECGQCIVCHSPNDRKKKSLNKYGQAIKEALPYRNVKNRELVAKAIKQAEKLKPRACEGAPNPPVVRNLSRNATRLLRRQSFDPRSLRDSIRTNGPMPLLLHRVMIRGAGRPCNLLLPLTPQPPIR